MFLRILLWNVNLKRDFGAACVFFKCMRQFCATLDQSIRFEMAKACLYVYNIHRCCSTSVNRLKKNSEAKKKTYSIVKGRVLIYVCFFPFIICFYLFFIYMYCNHTWRDIISSVIIFSLIINMNDKNILNTLLIINAANSIAMIQLCFILYVYNMPTGFPSTKLIFMLFRFEISSDIDIYYIIVLFYTSHLVPAVYRAIYNSLHAYSSSSSSRK